MNSCAASSVFALALALGCNTRSGSGPEADAGFDAGFDADVDSGVDAGADAALAAACGIDCCGSVPQWIADATWPYPIDTAVVDLAVGADGQVVAAASSSYEITHVAYVEAFSSGLRDRSERVVSSGVLIAAAGVTFGPDGSIYFVGTQGTGPEGTEPQVLVAGLGPDGVQRWTRAFVGPPPAGVVWTPTGELVIAGALHQSTDLGGGTRAVLPGSFAVYLLALRADGAYAWDRIVAVSTWANVTDIAASPTGELTIVGAFTGPLELAGAGTRMGAGVSAPSAFVLRLDAAGAYVWDRTPGDAAGGDLQRVAARADGTVVALGHFAGPVDFGGGPRRNVRGGFDGVIAFAVDGSYLWDADWQADGYGTSTSVAASAEGRVCVVGTFSAGRVDAPLDVGCGLLGRDIQPGGLVCYAADGTRESTRTWRPMAARRVTPGAIASGPSRTWLIGGALSGTVDFGGGARTGAVFGGTDAFVVLLQDVP